jgi:hypothetical protein
MVDQTGAESVWRGRGRFRPERAAPRPVPSCYSRCRRGLSPACAGVASRLFSHSPISASSQPTALLDSRRGGGNCPAFTIRQTDERQSPIRLDTSTTRSTLGPAGGGAGSGTGTAFHRAPRPLNVADSSSWMAIRSCASCCMRLSISEARPCNSATLPISTARSSDMDTVLLTRFIVGSAIRERRRHP